jgi:hypothetical protein
MGVNFMVDLENTICHTIKIVDMMLCKWHLLKKCLSSKQNKSNLPQNV